MGTQPTSSDPLHVSSDPPRIIVGGVPEHFNLPWHQAIEQQAFSPLGVDVEFVEYRGGTGAMTAALRERKIDISVLLTEGCVADLLNGNPSKIVKVFVDTPLIWGIHVAANSPIQSVDQIRGSRYAISRLGSGSHLMAIVDAAERGWPVDEIEFVTIKNIEGARAALANGDADVFFWEKYMTNPLVVAGEFRRLGIRETLWPAFVVCVHQECLDQHGDAVRQILEIVNQKCSALMQNSAAVELISNRYQLRPDRVQEWFGLTRWNLDFQRPLTQLQSARNYLEKLELVEGSKLKTEELWYEL